MDHSYDHQAELQEIRAFLATHANFQTESTLAHIEWCAKELLANWPRQLVSAELEGHTHELFMQRMGMDIDRSVAHLTATPGDTHHTAVLVALAQCFPGFAEDGLATMESPPRLYAAGDGVEAYRQISRTVGLGSRAVRAVPVDAQGRLEVTSLRKAIIEDAREGFTPFFIAVDVGSNATATIDPLKKLVALGRVQGMWVHVNAAVATPALFAEPTFAELDGLGFADSVCLDAHRGLGVPLETAMFYCRHPRPVAKIDQAIFADPSAQAMQLFLHLGLLGLPGLARQFDRRIQFAQHLREQFTERGWSILDQGLLPLVCALPAGGDSKQNREQLEEAAQSLQNLDFVWVGAVQISEHQTVLQIEISDNLEASENLIDAAGVSAELITNSIK
jgi:aromatic-L-amino-acid/L-tryptophan decarboxylase